IGYENGVLGGIACAFRAFTQPGEPVLVNSPTYIGFQSVFRDTGRKMVTSELYKDETGTWRMDYEDMEKKIIEQHIRTAIFCSPHNPTGRVWEKEEIEKAMEIFKKHDVLVLSDEIWSDI
ncbi:MAG TPA: aspartate aminotransferase, partial [Erysipelotrichaceae bacterium]|nr:aspartate aminotransferase [Erysipelotrichaceae bacterium]